MRRAHARARRSARGPWPTIGSVLILLVLLAVSWPLSFGPLLDLLAALSWQETSCRIVYMRLNQSRAMKGGGSRYSIHYEFRYDLAGKAYYGTREHFGPGEDAYNTGDADAVKPHADGTSLPCWFNPQKPDQAVLERRVTGVAWFVLIPWLTALGFGLQALIRAHRGKPRKPGKR